MTGSAPTGQHRKALGFEQGRPTELRQVLFVRKDGEEVPIPITADISAERFKNLIAHIDMSQIAEVHLYADESEMNQIHQTLKQLWPDVDFGPGKKPEGSVTYGPPVIDFTVTERYFRGLAKIGFHYFLTQITRFTGAEDIFGDIRDFIMTEGPLDRVNHFVSCYTGQLLPELAAGMKPSHWFHLITAEVDYHNLASHVQLFMGPEFRAPIWRIQLAKNPSPVVWDEFYGSLYVYHDEHKRDEYDGEVHTSRAVRR